MFVAVFDIGGSHISSATYDTSSAALVDEISSAHFSESGAGGPLDILLSLASHAARSNLRKINGLSIAAPGPFDYANGISQMQHKLTQLYGVDLKCSLAEVTQLLPASFVFVNDADAFLLGALASSPAPQLRSIGIALGTGIGSGFAVNGEVVTTGVGVPPGGEIWNLPFEEATVEDAISTRAIVGAYGRRTGTTLTVKAIAEAARNGDVDAREVFIHFGLKLAQVLKQICSAFTPEQILLGGGIVAAADLFLPSLQLNLERSKRIVVVTDTATVPLVGAGVAWNNAILGGPHVPSLARG